MTDRTKRSRIISICLIAIVAWLGINSRRHATLLPDFIAPYAGDTLWALDVFLGIGLVFPSSATWRVALGAFALTVAVEFSHLYHAPWIDAVRETNLGTLLLGYGFNSSALTSSAIGVGVGMVVEFLTLE